MNQIIKKLKPLQNIVPDAGFALSSKNTLMNAIKMEKSGFIVAGNNGLTYRPAFTAPGFWAGFAVMAATIFVIILLGNIQNPNIARSISDIASIEENASSFENDINITLQEIKSYGDSAEKTSLALYEASSNGPAHLNSSLIRKELDTIDVDLPDPKKANDLLDQAIL
ncbi:MAG: hypothetical protein PHS16_02100 [Candidatus Colwellbacteria bacterium]|jgi:hypothetical protein|nr:hypothetical protein [Candidatus Colwellbacteria bacterium]MCK9497353.1 hypothetical protein [Candidatus Colwellbacteria bacterium]MDD3752707.1 hypothetical protein [Candidatus Colwellbacteria bacterium]MDD4818751.1 hypothetical protein [Candidatus Colwellbacteria bacterium]